MRINPPLAQTRDKVNFAGTSTGSANAQTLAGVADYQDGMIVEFIAGYTNTGALTIDGLAVQWEGVALVGKEIVLGRSIRLRYDGTTLQLLSPSPLVACRLSHNGGAQTAAANTLKKLAWDTALQDPYGMWSSGANTKITVPVAGYYKIATSIEAYHTVLSDTVVANVYQNGSSIASPQCGFSNTYLQNLDLNIVAWANAGDYFEIGSQTLATGVPTWYTVALNCVFRVERIR